MAPGELDHAIGKLTSSNKNLLTDLSSNEDAGVYKIDEKRALVQSVDMITPVVDDPYYYGQIAAANSLSDIFAMDAEVLTAMNIVGFDGCHQDAEVLREILRGAQDKLNECGGAIVGGHTIETPEMLFGLSVTGVVSPDNFWRNNTIKDGDLLILTKPLGMGILTTALKADLIDENIIKMIVAILSQLNHKASKTLKRFGVHACTDVTGFGLLGHAYEMIGDESLSIKIYKDRVPILNDAYEMADMGIIPAGSYANKEYLKDKVKLFCEEDITLFDAQTSGGLLVAVKDVEAKEIVNALKNEGYEHSSIIGEVKKRDSFALEVV